MYSLYSDMSVLADHKISPQLLPLSLQQTTNSDVHWFRRVAVDCALKSQLTAVEKELLLAHYSRGEKQKDLAQRLGMSPSAVSRRLKIAREKVEKSVNFAVSAFQQYGEEKHLS